MLPLTYYSRIKNGEIPRYSMGTIKLSLINRLICMSVGRIKIWNYKSFDNNCSWIKAFSILGKNQWSVKQMKCLDKHRGVIINRASKQLKCFECPSNTKSNIMDDFTNRYMYFGWGHLVIMGNALYINKLFENILLSYDYTIL